MKMNPILIPGEVHIWTASISADLFSCDLRETLSKEECEKAERFRFEEDRQSYISTHAFLRDLLGLYLAKNARSLRFKCDVFGKPVLVGSDDQSRLCFNLSHSCGVALVAVVFDRHIGADVEKVRLIDDLEHIAKAHFTEQELAFVLSQDSEERAQAFFHFWTRKESYVKALGKGLSIPLSSFDTCASAGKSGFLLPRSQEMPDVENWWIADVDVPVGYAGAVTVERGCERLMHFRWNVSTRRPL